VDSGHGPGHHPAVLRRITGSGRSPGAIGQRPSTVVAHQIGGGQEQLAWAGEVDLVDRSLRTGYAAATTCGRLHDNRSEET
jgi:hypothetical protein